MFDYFKHTSDVYLNFFMYNIATSAHQIETENESQARRSWNSRGTHMLLNAQIIKLLILIEILYANT